MSENLAELELPGKKNPAGAGFLMRLMRTQLQVAIIRWLGERSPALGAERSRAPFHPAGCYHTASVYSYTDAITVPSSKYYLKPIKTTGYAISKIFPFGKRAILANFCQCLGRKLSPFWHQLVSRVRILIDNGHDGFTAHVAEVLMAREHGAVHLRPEITGGRVVGSFERPGHAVAVRVFREQFRDP